MPVETNTAPHRKVTVSFPSDREVAVTRDFDAPQKLAFEVFTSAEHLPRWMLGPDGWSMPICESDVRNGGSWRCVWRDQNGTEMVITGVYQEVTPYHRIVHTESWGPEWPETLNTTEFADLGARTRVTMTLLYPTPEARDAALKTGMDEGMDQSYDRLDDYLKQIV